MREFTLPSLGADMDEGKLIEWLVKPGDEVHKGQAVAIVDTAKAAVDVEIWYDGVVDRLITVPGQTVPVGATIATILAPGETAPEPATPAGPEPGQVAPEPAAPGPPPEPVGAAAAARPAARTGPPAPGPHPEPGSRRRISPAARRHAEDLGVDLDAVTGTGPLGSVTLADVDRAATVPGPSVPGPAAPGPGAPGPAAPGPGVPPPVEAATPAQRQAMMREAIAAAMSRSKREIPHYYLSETIPMARAVDWLAGQNAARPITERVLMAVLQLKAVARALTDFPQLNGFFIDGSFRPAPVVQIGVAIALRPAGLVAPALHDVADKDMPTLMRELSDLVARARSASLRSSELTDPTITVTNLGDQGVESVFGIITPPQVALVGFGRVAPRPFVTDAGLAAVPTVTASLAADHRVTDGHTGAMFLAALHEWLQRPEDL